MRLIDQEHKCGKNHLLKVSLASTTIRHQEKMILEATWFYYYGDVFDSKVQQRLQQFSDYKNQNCELEDILREPS